MSTTEKKFRFVPELSYGDLLLAVTLGISFTAWLVRLEGRIERSNERIQEIVQTQHEIQENYRVAQESIQSVQRTQAILATLMEERTKRPN